MKKLNKLEQSIYDEYIKIKPEKLKRVEEIRNRKETRFIEFPFSSDHVGWNILRYDKTLNRFVLIEYPVYVNDDIELKTIELVEIQTTKLLENEKPGTWVKPPKNSLDDILK